MSSSTTLHIVYFIHSGDLIKIGTTTNLDKRMKGFHPDITLLGTIPGDVGVERQVHQLFKRHLSSRREWFADSALLRIEIADLVEGRTVLAPLQPANWSLGGWHSPGEFGALHREVRTSAGLSQQEAAESVGVSRKWLSEFEQGKVTVELGLVLRCFAAFGIAFTPAYDTERPCSTEGSNARPQHG